MLSYVDRVFFSKSSTALTYVPNAFRFVQIFNSNNVCTLTYYNTMMSYMDRFFSKSSTAFTYVPNELRFVQIFNSNNVCTLIYYNNLCIIGLFLL